MFYVSISRKALDLVMKKAKGTDREIIGVLVGRTEKHTIVISEAISGEQESGDVRAQLPPSTIAKVTDKILKGKIKGRIVGWYHSHPGFGLFMSGTDISTQKNLQQFSSKVTALIVDPEKETFGFFTLHEPQGVVQLDDNQIHVFDKGEEEVPKRFSKEPEVPKKATRSHRRAAMAPIPMPEPGGAGTTIMIIGVVAAMVGLSIGLILFGPRITVEEPDISSVDTIRLLGESKINQVGVPIFEDDIEVRANITIAEGKIRSEGVRFYYGLEGLNNWQLINNTSFPFVNSSTYGLIIDTNRIPDGIYQIKVNFTDSKNHTWHKVSRKFIIDNVPDFPEPLILFPYDGDTLTGRVEIISKVWDEENNIHKVKLQFMNATINWTTIIDTTNLGGGVYQTFWDTRSLNETTPYALKVYAEDRNIYIEEHYITVEIKHEP
jgi:proteasome lid subunit RPN8/RPN11